MAFIHFTLLLLWAKSNQKPFRAAMPVGLESFSTFCVTVAITRSFHARLGSPYEARRKACPSLFLWLGSDGNLKLLHATFLNGLSGPIFFPTAAQKQKNLAGGKSIVAARTQRTYLLLAGGFRARHAYPLEK